MKNAVDMMFEIETKLLAEINSLLLSGKHDIAEWKLIKLKEIGKLQDVSLEIIKSDLPKAVRMANDTLIEKAKEASTLNGLLPATASETLRATWKTFEEMQYKNFSRLGAKLMRGVEDAYIDIIETASLQVISGQATLRDSIRYASKKWVDTGILQQTGTLVDASGRKWSIEGYTQMITRTAIRNVTTETQKQVGIENDFNLVEVSSHIGARPLCAEYQGQRFLLQGSTKDYPNLYTDTSYGEAAGLFGVNCGHTFYPVLPDMEQTYKLYPEKENKKVYEESQKQRYYERQIRYLKRDTAVNGVNHSEKIKAYNDKIKEMGRTVRKDREEIYI